MLVYFIIAAILITIFIVTVYFNNRTKTQTSSSRSGRHRPRKRSEYDRQKLPQNLKLQPDVPLQAAESRLEAALSAYFGDQLKIRMLQKYPRMSPAEFDWHFLELKRYFVMTAVMKQVPMYSEAVDGIWHEMLMFTREYQRFSESYIGTTIHHAPHGQSLPNPGERAWFDWVYAHLFAASPFSGKIWKGFFRFPLDRERMEQFRTETDEELMERLFNTRTAQKYPEIRETIQLLISKARDQIRRTSEDTSYPVQHHQSGADEYLPYAAGAMMFYSMADSINYEEHMKETMITEEQKKTSAGSSCTSGGHYGVDAGSSSRDSHGGSDGGGISGDSGSGSSSSCSSSSCGGGGGD